MKAGEMKGSLLEERFSSCHKLKFQSRWLKNKGAILVLIWSYLTISVYHFYAMSATRNPMKHKSHLPLNPGEILAAGIFFPIGGWLADAYFGRYKVILCGMWTMWLGAMLNGVGLVTAMLVPSYKEHGDPWVSLICRIILGAGFGLFQANIIQFGIDQLLEASSTEIISFVSWYTLTIFACGLTMQFSSSCPPHHAIVVVLAIHLSMALSSNYVFNYWLDKEQKVFNSLPLIRKTVQYTIKNRKKWKRLFALGNHSALSKLNIAKVMYGGPFLSEQVEDVKTFFRVLAVIALVLAVFSGIPSTMYDAGILEPRFHHRSHMRVCYKELSINYAHFILTVFAVLLYRTIIHPVCHKYIPRVKTTTRMFISILLYFTSVMILLSMESVSYHKQLGLNQTITKCNFQSKSRHQDIQSYLVIVPQTMIALSAFLFISVGIEFVCAQAPLYMKGLLFGIGYALYGLGSLVQSAISIPFHHNRSVWDKAPLTCGIWYFITQAVIVLVGFIIVIIVIKTYRRRTRPNVPQSKYIGIDSVNAP